MNLRNLITAINFLICVYINAGVALALLALIFVIYVVLTRFKNLQILHILLPIYGLCIFLVSKDVFSITGLSFGFFRIYSCFKRFERDTFSPKDAFAYVFLAPSFVAGPILSFTKFRAEFKKLRMRMDLTIIQHLVFGLFFMLCASSFCSFLLEQIEFQNSLFFTRCFLSYLYLFFNFQGYSLIAIGTSGLMSVSLPINFDNPFAASNTTDFWSRQHISLSNWLKENIFLPISIKYKTRVSATLAALLTLLISSIWHGLNIGSFIFFSLQVFCLFCFPIRQTKTLLQLLLFQLITSISIYFLVFLGEASLATLNIGYDSLFEVLLDFTFYTALLGFISCAQSTKPRLAKLGSNCVLQELFLAFIFSLTLITVFIFKVSKIEFLYSRF